MENKNKKINSNNNKKTKNIEEKNNFLLIYLKGFLMGTCDVVPGISGGTIAFITGIYERFIRSIKNLSSKRFFLMWFLLIKGDFNKFKSEFVELELDFLIVLLTGIFSAIFLVSKLILFLLSNFESYTLIFFVGLILASSIYVFKEIKHHNLVNYIVGIIGFLTGIFLIFLNTTELSNPTPLYIIFGGMLAISAMFLPGVSGSFILLVLGLYNIVYSSLHDILNSYMILIYFGIGIVIGAILISRIIDFLFRWDKSKTLYYLTGLIIGALSVPIKQIFTITNFNSVNILIMMILLIIGFGIVFYTEKISKKILKKKEK